MSPVAGAPGVPGGAVGSLYDPSPSLVLVLLEVSRTGYHCVGLRQRCPLSPVLFIIDIIYIYKDVASSRSILINIGRFNLNVEPYCHGSTSRAVTSFRQRRALLSRFFFSLPHLCALTGRHLLVTVSTLVLISALIWRRPLLSVWSVPHRLGTLATQRLWMFIIQSVPRQREETET